MKTNFPTSRDPVCGLDVIVAESTHSTTWHGFVYHFCSEQCQERFVTAPAFYTAPIRTKDIVAIPKRRKLRFVSPGEEALRAACGKLLRMMGVSAAVPGADCITVYYDLRQATFAQIEAVVAGSGLVLRSGLHRWRRSLWKFEEGNEIDNVAHPSNGACCNRPPVRLR